MVYISEETDNLIGKLYKELKEQNADKPIKIIKAEIIGKAIELYAKRLGVLIDVKQT